MNTELESSSQKTNDFGKLESGAPLTKLDDAASILAEHLQAEKEGRCEERFAWIFVVVLLGDFIGLPHMGAEAIAVVLLEIVFLIYMARMLGVDWVVVHLERVFAAIDRRKDKD